MNPLQKMTLETAFCEVVKNALAEYDAQAGPFTAGHA
jgi:hypothetical protein